MVFLHSNNAKVFEREMLNKQVFQMKKNEILNHMKGFFTTASFISMKVSTKNKPMDIIIDGNLYEDV
jgi:hypothetical protein